MLGLGTTLGIVVQAVSLLPAIRRLGVSGRPLFGWDPRLAQASGLAVWAVIYVLIGQAGYVVTTRVAADSAVGAVGIYANTWLLLQVPYGVLGVSLLTALMPRMSRAAAEGRNADVVADLSLGSRLLAIFLIPVSVLLTVFGPQVGTALFGLRSANLDGAAQLGAALALSAFGLLPFGITMLQARVFYALTDSRTPTLIQLVTVAVKIPMLLLCAVLLPPTGRGARAGRGEQRIVPGRGRASGSCCCAAGWAGSRPPGCWARWAGRWAWRCSVACWPTRRCGWPAGRSPGSARRPGPGSSSRLAFLIITPVSVIGLRLLGVAEMNPFVVRLERLVDRWRPRRGGVR